MKRCIGLVATITLLASSGCMHDETEVLRKAEAVVALAIDTKVIDTRADGDRVIEDSSFPAGYSLGVHLAEPDGTGDYEPVKGAPQLRSHGVRFTSDDKGGWNAYSEKERGEPFYLTKRNAGVYAWYPYLDAEGQEIKIPSGQYGPEATIPVALLETGTIDELKQDAAVNTAVDERDYMWAALPGDSRFVNSGKESEVLTEGNKTGNPGPVIHLPMKHALALVSFRFYNDGRFFGPGVVTGFSLRNSRENEFGTHPAGMQLTAGTNPVMNISTGNITTGEFKPVVLGRTLTEGIYTMPKVSETMSVEAAIAASPWVSLLVFPVDVLTANALTVDITIDGEVFTLPLAHGSTTAWQPGVNHRYTVKASGRQVSVASVAATPWNEQAPVVVPVQ
ncbi:MAG: fimbrillin family protein [Parabacteroides gordonii]|uniref:fimbrillin family protein n=1 Tax=Parabacteroides gordonii TaxID=574930 RepID=UPI003A86B908